MKVALCLVLALLLNSCSYFDLIESVEQQALQFTNDDKRHRPTECRHLYNVGKSIEWMECMGVGLK